MPEAKSEAQRFDVTRRFSHCSFFAKQVQYIANP